jgi:hypothetical protein
VIRGRRSGMRAAQLFARSSLAVVVLGLTACGNTRTEPPTAPQASSADASSPTGTSTPSGRPGSAPPVARPETISGAVTAGVGHGCLILTDAHGSHVLVFNDPALKASVSAGTTVTVTGAPAPTLMTYCQQGEPFIVTQVSRH